DHHCKIRHDSINGYDVF
nr:immunoglobulin light chain junction region [Macaca mulatta]